MKSMNDTLKRQVASLESKLDLLESELTNLDGILRKCGFPNGISTLKSTVEELIAETKRYDESDET